MAERPARVLIIATHPALAALPEALRAVGVETQHVTRSEDAEWFLHTWQRACVAVLDATLPDARLFAALHQRLHEPPPVPTLVVFDERYSASPRDLAPRDAHAQLPLEASELVAAVGHVLRRAGYPTPWLPAEEPAAGPPRGQAIVVFSLKGGVGRSTIAAYLAVSLARQHARDVILLDADPWRGDLAVLLNLRLGRGLADLVPRDREVVDLDAVREALLLHPSGVRLLPMPDDPILVEMIPPLLPARMVEICKTLAEYVVVDTAPTLDDLTLHVLDVADRVLVVLTPEVSAVRHASRLLKLAPHLRLEGRITLVLNRANSGLSEAQVTEMLGARVDARLVSAGLALLDAANRGRTLVEADARLAEPITRDLARLAALVTNAPAPAPAAAPPTEQPPKRASLYTSLLGVRATVASRLRRPPPSRDAATTPAPAVPASATDAEPTAGTSPPPGAR